MKKNCLSVVVATAILATGLLTSCKQEAAPVEPEPATPVDTAAIVLDNIMTRTSIRQYQNTPVADSVVENILRAAMAAPTARNTQPWSFIVVKDTALLRQIAEACPNAGMCAQAPLAIVVCGDESKMMQGESREMWVDDCSAATENILLMAHAYGLGAVWTGFYPVSERVKLLCGILGIPEGQIPLCVIPMGYPAENPAPKDKWKTENIHYDKW